MTKLLSAKFTKKNAQRRLKDNIIRKDLSYLVTLKIDYFPNRDVYEFRLKDWLIYACFGVIQRHEIIQGLRKKLDEIPLWKLKQIK